MYLDVHEQLELVRKSERSSHERLPQRGQTYETFTNILSRSEICTMRSCHFESGEGEIWDRNPKSRQRHKEWAHKATVSEG